MNNNKMIKIAMLGRSEGNGHPYSWSAIINGRYDKERMRRQPFPVIYDYLSKEPEKNLGIENAKVTHIWTEDKKDAKDIAATCMIDNVVDNMEDVIGKVDAVIIAEDIGKVHLKMARPFIEKDIPVFIDKPLTDNKVDLENFIKYFKDRKKILSSSGFSYAKEFENIATYDLGSVMYVNCLMNKAWGTYGVHSIAGVCNILGGGVESVVNLGREEFESVHLQYSDGKQAIISQIYTAGMARFDIIGSKGTKVIMKFDSFYMFKKQLEDFINFIKSGKYPYSYEITVEQIKILIAGRKSRDNGGERIFIR
ncbi:MAG: Gfo/Idh/MocA family oxidoreductase [Actinobacteria bacterium]|nr:Gfo/Idh/MocA family oxidoreductase [Actinomycetota bacterium]